MLTTNLEEQLTEMSFVHLTAQELAAHLEHDLDPVTHARVDAHLRHCLICEQHRALLGAERAAHHTDQITEQELLLIHRLLDEPSGEVPSVVSLWDNLTIQVMDALGELRSALSGAGFQAEIAAAATAVPDTWQHGETTEHIHWSIGVEDETIILELRSKDLRLAGIDLELQLGEWHQVTKLKRIAPDQVGTVLFIPIAELGQWEEPNLVISPIVQTSRNN